MANDKKKEEDKVIVAEFKVSMHCNACERTVAKAISKFKGVEKFTTDMRKHRVEVTGRINPEKVMKKLKRKTGKRIEMVVKKEDSKEDIASSEGDSKPVVDSSMFDYYWRENEQVLMMFSEENPNACFIM